MSALREIRQCYAALASKQQIFTIDDIIDCSDHLHLGTRSIHVCFSRRSLIDSSRLMINSISFSRVGNNIQRYRDKDEALALRAELEAHPNSCTVYHREHVDLFVEHVARQRSAKPQEAELLSHYADLCELFFTTSDVFANMLSSYAHSVTQAFFGQPNASESGDKRNPYQALSEYLSNRFPVTAMFVVETSRSVFRLAHPAASNVNHAWTTHVIRSEGVRQSLDVAITRRQRISGRVPDAEGRSIYYCVIPVLAPHPDQAPERPVVGVGALLVTATVRLDPAYIVAAEDLRDAILIRHNLLGQSQFARTLHDRLFRHSTFDGFTAVTRSDLDSRFRQFADECTAGIVHYTSASSAVVRLHDPFSGKLVPTSVRQTDQGVYDEGEPQPMDATDLCSVNGYCFTRCSSDQYVYVQNVHEIPEEYRKNGLAGVSQRRATTSSEICFPIDRHGLRLGTLNVESPAFSAFDPDILFLADIVKCLADYYGRIRSLNDREWLSRLANRQIWIHKLKNFREQMKDHRLREEFDSITSAILSAPVPTMARSDHQSESIETIVADLRHTMAKYPDWKGNIRVDEDAGRINLPHYIADPLRSICLALLENSTKHKSTDDELELAMIAGHSPSVDELRLRYISNGTVDRETLNHLGVSPFRRQGNEDVHFGLFSVGVHVRLLGGVVEFPTALPNRTYTEMEVHIRLPVSTRRVAQAGEG